MTSIEFVEGEKPKTKPMDPIIGDLSCHFIDALDGVQEKLGFTSFEELKEVERIGQEILDIVRDRKAKYLTLEELYAIPAPERGSKCMGDFGSMRLWDISYLKVAALRYLLGRENYDGDIVLEGLVYSPPEEAPSPEKAAA